MVDHTLNRSYQGKVFLFEKCLIYTEQIDDDKLEYRGHYECDQLLLREYDGVEKFVLYSKVIGCNQMEFLTETSQLEEWHTMLIAKIKEGEFGSRVSVVQQRGTTNQAKLARQTTVELFRVEISRHVLLYFTRLFFIQTFENGRIFIYILSSYMEYIESIGFTAKILKIFFCSNHVFYR
jgi:hypothetical protein